MNEEEGLNVEIGPRTDPLVWTLRDDLLAGKDVAYIDINSDWSQSLQSQVKRNVDGWELSREGTGQKAFVIQGDGGKLPLSADSVGMIFASNLFGAEGHGQSLKDRYDRNPLLLPPRSEITKNWFDKLQSGGRVVILENATPPNVETLKNDFKESGFTLQEEHYGNDVGKIFAHKDVSSIYSNNDPSYALVFVKAKAQSE